MNTPEIRPWLKEVELIGGEPCVDFVNSVSDCIGPAPVEQLRSYAELLFWLHRCGLLSREEAADLGSRARRDPAAADASLPAIRRFRDAAWRLLSAAARGDSPGDADLVEVNRWVKKAYGHIELLPQARGEYRIAGRGAEDDLGRAVWPAARALAEFLASDKLAAVHICASDTCGWLFVDRSRTHRRRWCSMSDCGNLAKQRRHRARKRA